MALQQELTLFIRQMSAPAAPDQMAILQLVTEQFQKMTIQRAEELAEMKRQAEERTQEMAEMKRIFEKEIEDLRIALNKSKSRSKSSRSVGSSKARIVFNDS